MSKILVLSKLAANRAEFFKLLADLERIEGREIDDWKLTGEIDSKVNGRHSVSKSDAHRIMSAIT